MSKNPNKIRLVSLSDEYKSLKSEIDKSIRRVLISGRYILGNELKTFEENFAKYCHARYCVGTSSGFMSLFLSLLALGVKSGDEVVTVPNTFTATAESIALVGAKIVFCDVEPGTFNISPSSLLEKVSSRTKAVIPVHLHGNPAKMDEIITIAKKHNLFIVEDAAQAHGATYKGKIIGSLASNITCFSFHPVKNLGAVGDAGAVVTNNINLAKKLRMLTNHGRSDHIHHDFIGTTGRLDPLQSAVLNVKLKRLNAWLKKRRTLAKYYEKKLHGIVEFMQETPKAKSARHVFAILVNNREKVMQFLSENKIETGIHYPIPLHLQKAYKYLGYKRGDFPVAEYYASKTLSIPFYPLLKVGQADYVIEKVKKYYDQK